MNTDVFSGQISCFLVRIVIKLELSAHFFASFAHILKLSADFSSFFPDFVVISCLIRSLELQKMVHRLLN